MSNTQESISKIDFKKMIERNLKKNEGTPISGLLKSTTQEVLPKQSSSSESRLDKIKIENLTDKIDNLEALIHSIIINQQNLKHSITFQEEVKELPKKKNQFFNDSNKLLLASTLLLSVACFYYYKQSTPNEVNKAVITKEIRQLVTTKFINLRTDPSTRSKVLTVVSPNSVISLLEENNDWQKVEFKNFAKEVSFVGWIYSGNTKEMTGK